MQNEWWWRRSLSVTSTGLDDWSPGRYVWHAWCTEPWVDWMMDVWRTCEWWELRNVYNCGICVWRYSCSQEAATVYYFKLCKYTSWGYGRLVTEPVWTIIKNFTNYYKIYLDRYSNSQQNLCVSRLYTGKRNLFKIILNESVVWVSWSIAFFCFLFVCFLR